MILERYTAHSPIADDRRPPSTAHTFPSTRHLQALNAFVQVASLIESSGITVGREARKGAS